jgi:ribosomal protein L12E/L44/L45/RPP1/RPP2
MSDGAPSGRRALVWIATALAAGAVGYGAFTAVGPPPADEREEHQQQQEERQERREDRRDEGEDDAGDDARDDVGDDAGDARDRDED